MKNYSVLMTIYKDEKPSYFKASIESMLSQTIPTDDFVVVCDGELTDELNNIITEYKSKYNDLFNIIRLDKNYGVGYASAKGVVACKNDLIAKMDSDDISYPIRCEKELNEFEKNPELVLVGSFVREFSDNKSFIRKVPVEYEQIVKFSRLRSPFNNPTIMFSKSAVIEVGNHSRLRRGEDYELFAKLIRAGKYVTNIPECLLDYRISENTYAKRNNYGELKQSYNVARKIGHISNSEYIFLCFVQFVFSKMPVKLRQFSYECMIRRD